MDGLSGVIESVVRSKNDCFGAYLDEIFENNILDPKVSEVVVQYISSALSKSVTCREGLVVLNCYMKHASLVVLEQRASLWTSLVLRALNSDENEVVNLSYSALSLLALNSLRVPEVSKSFLRNNLGSIYESLCKVSLFGPQAALKCVEDCLRLYPGPSGPFRKPVEEFLFKFIDSPAQEFGIASGKCMHLLQQVRGGGVQGISHRESWLNYQRMLIGSLHNVLDLAFSNCNEIYDKTFVSSQNCGFPDLKLSDEPTKRAAQLFIRFQNLVNFLIIAIRNPYPVAKLVLPKKLLHLISRGLSVTIPILNINSISENLALGVFLPKMHILLLDLLQALVTSLGTNLRPHYKAILGLAVHELNWTSKRNFGGSECLSNVRSKAYEVLLLWCTVMHNGSKIEMYAETLIKEIIHDTVPCQNECTLKVLSGAKKHMSKKSRRLLHNAENEKSKIVQSFSHNNFHGKENIVDERGKKLCASALRTLEKLLVTATSFLKPSQIKVVQIRIVQICALFYEIPMKQEQLYNNWECRLEVFKVLHTLMKCTHKLCPPPSHIINDILQNAFMRDRNSFVRQECAELLRQIEIIVHPRKESLLFPVDIREVRNAFIKSGQEHLISEETYVEFSDQCCSDIDGSENFQKNEIVVPPKDLEEQHDKNDKYREDTQSSLQSNSTIVSEEIVPYNHSNTVIEEVIEDFTLQSKFKLRVEENFSVEEEFNEKQICLEGEPSYGLNDVLREPFRKKQRLEENEDGKAHFPKNTLRKEEFDAEVQNVETIPKTDEDIFADIESAFVDELSEMNVE